MKSKEDYAQLISKTKADLKDSKEEYRNLTRNMRALYPGEYEKIRKLERHIKRMELKINHYTQKLFEVNRDFVKA